MKSRSCCDREEEEGDTRDGVSVLDWVSVRLLSRSLCDLVSYRGVGILSEHSLFTYKHLVQNALVFLICMRSQREIGRVKTTPYRFCRVRRSWQCIGQKPCRIEPLPCREYCGGELSSISGRGVGVTGVCQCVG
jgi:hypothetical protein